MRKNFHKPDTSLMDDAVIGNAIRRPSERLISIHTFQNFYTQNFNGYIYPRFRGTKFFTTRGHVPTSSDSENALAYFRLGGCRLEFPIESISVSAG
jgi:hypothetical protein